LEEEGTVIKTLRKAWVLDEKCIKIGDLCPKPKFIRKSKELTLGY